MKHILVILALFSAFNASSQFCPALGPDQILPCGVASTTLTADLSQCAAGTYNFDSLMVGLFTNISYIKRK